MPPLLKFPVAATFLVGCHPPAAISSEHDDLFEHRYNHALCTWQLMTSLDIVGELCFPGEDSEFEARIRTPIDRLERTISAETGIPREAMKRFKLLKNEQMVKMIKSEASKYSVTDGKELCYAGRNNFMLAWLYESRRRFTTEEFRTWVEYMLNSPADPERRPCIS